MSTLWNKLLRFKAAPPKIAPSPPSANGHQNAPDERVEWLRDALDAVYRYARQEERAQRAEIDLAHPRFRASARNLVHYLALRNLDLREAQVALAELGLSSLGRSEAHVLASLNAVRAALYTLSGKIVPAEKLKDDAVSFETSRRMLEENARAILGRAPETQHVRIMVTLPSQAADDYALVRQLVARGMNVARVNTAHDDRAAWARMMDNVRLAARNLGSECRILMDLAGPKVRTGPLQPGPKVLHIRPERDLEGHVTIPARVWLAPDGTPPPEGERGGFILPIVEKWTRPLHPGDRITLTDPRGKPRKLTVMERRDDGVWAETDQSIYIKAGTRLKVKRFALTGKRMKSETLYVGEIERKPNFIRLKKGDTLILLKGSVEGAPAVYNTAGTVLEPARISCTLPQVVEAMQVGERVMFDDGKIESVVREVLDEGVALEITLAEEKGTKLLEGKGINTPDTEIQLAGLTDQDRANLDFVIENADLVAMSFVNSPDDVAELQKELAQRGAKDFGILLKIETRRGFEQLPRILLRLMQSYPAGVMIARGDLAVELGWERMAEVQEEILWLCEAAHLPSVWATQVLESLAKKGLPSRAEITDAAMAQRAECVMLNKGPYILDAISTLSDILERMQEHQTKKTALLRSLDLSHMTNEE